MVKQKAEIKTGSKNIKNATHVNSNINAMIIKPATILTFLKANNRLGIKNM